MNYVYNAFMKCMKIILKNLTNYTKQDSIILNIQRACEASIDLAMHIVNERKLGVPKASREAFLFLQEAHIKEPDLAL